MQNESEYVENTSIDSKKIKFESLPIIRFLDCIYSISIFSKNKNLFNKILFYIFICKITIF